MSTSRSRLTRSIQEIAKRDPDLRRAIEATKPRGDQPSAAGVGASDAGRDRICCDGSVSDDANPGTEERDTSEGGQDASGGLNPGDTADISDMGPGSLAGITDCATGEPVCFDGAGFIPPDGWDAPNEPPPDPDWVVDENAYWYLPEGDPPNHPPEHYARTKGQMKSHLIAYLESRGLYLCGWSIDSDTRVRVRQSTNESCSPLSSVTLGRSAELRECSDYPNETWCGTNYGNPEPSEIQHPDWPEDGCVNLAIKSGSIVGSKYDPENDGSYSKPMSEIELCDDFGNSFYLSPSAGGGWKTINATKDAGYLWSSTGQKIAHIDGNEYSDPSI